MRIAVAVAVVIGSSAVTLSGAFGASDSAPLATPLGILTQQTKAQKMVVYAEADGMTLYTYAGDTEPGKSTCVGACETTNPPARAPKGSLPPGWSTIKRPDGTQQLAYQDQPLYTCAADDGPGSMKCAPTVGVGGGRGRGGAAGGGAAAAAAPPPPPAPVDPAKAMWKAAVFNRTEKIATPPEIGLTDVAEAGGITLVTMKGMPLYAFSGDLKHDVQRCDQEICGGVFSPYTAPYIAGAVGDFTAITRPDGARQWVYKGKPLYTFSGDKRDGDARGTNVDDRYAPAMVVKFFIPPGISIHSDPRVGGVFTNADGMSLYAKDGIFYAGDGRGTTRGGLPGFFDLGLAIGTVACDKACTAMWHPVRAPKDAKPSGYWSIMTRDDGTRQWAYKDYALYSYTGDHHPGDLNGRETYDIKINDFTEGYTARIEAMRAASGRGNAFLGYVWRAANP